jgi:hypothetical protein
MMVKTRPSYTPAFGPQMVELVRVGRLRGGPARSLRISLSEPYADRRGDGQPRDIAALREALHTRRGQSQAQYESVSPMLGATLQQPEGHLTRVCERFANGGRRG